VVGVEAAASRQMSAAVAAVAVDEGELRTAMRALALRAGVVAEGAGAAAGAAVLAGRITPRPHETTVVVVSGRNVTAERLCEVLA